MTQKPFKQRRYKRLHVGLEVTIKRGNGRILALNRYPYGGPIPYVYIGSEDGHSWATYMKHSELHEYTSPVFDRPGETSMKQQPQFPRNEKHYCSECGQHLALHDDMPGSATEPSERWCPTESDEDSDYDMFDNRHDLPRPAGDFWEYLDNG